jgi:hypothetical protein
MEYSDDQGKMMIEHPMRSEEDRKKSLFFSILCDYLFLLHKGKERPTF